MEEAENAHAMKFAGGDAYGSHRDNLLFVKGETTHAKLERVHDHGTRSREYVNGTTVNATHHRREPSFNMLM